MLNAGARPQICSLGFGAKHYITTDKLSLTVYRAIGTLRYEKYNVDNIELRMHLTSFFVT